MPARKSTANEESAAGDMPPKLAAPAQRALASAGYTHLSQLTAVSQKELLQLHGMGPRALSQLRDALAAKGLSFRA